LGKSFRNAATTLALLIAVSSSFSGMMMSAIGQCLCDPCSNSAYAISTVVSAMRLPRLKIHSGNAARLCPLQLRYYTNGSPRNPPLVETDDCAIPLKPTWSVDDLLSSYPRPTISSLALDRLHVLSALIPPEEGTLEHANLIRELEDLVKLVESVRLFNVPNDPTPTHVVADARVWAENTGIDLQKVPSGAHDREALDPAELLSWASRTENGLYVMHSDRVTTKSVYELYVYGHKLIVVRTPENPCDISRRQWDPKYNSPAVVEITFTRSH